MLAQAAEQSLGSHDELRTGGRSWPRVCLRQHWLRHFRTRGYAELGLQAADLARKLCTHSGIPPEETHLGRDQNMKDVMEEVDVKRQAYELRRSLTPTV